jgi:hypothetical protein
MSNLSKLNNARLFIKQVSLAAEAQLIRKEEKNHYSVYGCNPIRQHRVEDVRWESRATHLARAFLKDKAYASVESSRKPEKEFHFRTKVLPRVKALVKKYGYKIEFDETWLND